MHQSELAEPIDTRPALRAIAPEATRIYREEQLLTLTLPWIGCSPREPLPLRKPDLWYHRRTAGELVGAAKCITGSTEPIAAAWKYNFIMMVLGSVERRVARNLGGLAVTPHNTTFNSRCLCLHAQQQGVLCCRPACWQPPPLRLPVPAPASAQSCLAPVHCAALPLRCCPQSTSGCAPPAGQQE